MWDAECGILEAGCRMRDAGCKIWDAGCEMKNVDAECGILEVGCGCGMQDAGCEMWDARCGMREAGCQKSSLALRDCAKLWVEMTGLKNVRYMGTHEHHGSVTLRRQILFKFTLYAFIKLFTKNGVYIKAFGELKMA